MSESELLRQCVTFTFTWFAAGPNPCHRCLLLNGRTWTEQTIWQPQLIDATLGAIWDFTIDQSLVHGGAGHGCNCILEISFDVDASKLESYQQFTKTYKEYMGEIAE